ncbi:MgtC/SapB family protein, partial [Candidatus Uhrbacteria bacterium]|nr:MgtC/SapB family protein [Candidatus Uhrbacteria bacterium]
MEAVLQLVIATVLGGAIGFQREVAKKAAGIRTYAFVAIGSCLFTILSRSGFHGAIVDPTRIAAQVVVGIGFLGAGLIFVRQEHVEGLTTAAGLWVVAAIGMSVAVSQYTLAITTTVVALLLLTVGRKLHVE